MNYNPDSAESIEQYAKRLIGSNLRTICDWAANDGATIGVKNKAGMGHLVEELYFGISKNSRAEPDFAKAGIELKTFGLVPHKKRGGLYPKEPRLSMNMINYMDEDWKPGAFQRSSFWRKNKHLLLIAYLHEAGVPVQDLVFNAVGTWEIRHHDLLIIERDWQGIARKVREGRAHELTEGENWYLTACTKASDGKARREQPYSKEPAKPRAYALRASYLDEIIRCGFDFSAPRNGQAVPDDILGEIGLDRAIIAQFEPFYGRTQSSLMDDFKISKVSKAKDHLLAKAILKVRTDKIDEFEKAGISIKTIALESNGRLKESMSFERIRYDEVAGEDWEDSTFAEIIGRKHLFVVFQKTPDDDRVLRRVFFWSLPFELHERAREFWENIRDNARICRYDAFWKQGEHRTFHVRPKATNSADRTTDTVDGKSAPKLAYWYNAEYVREVVNEALSH